MKCEICGYPKLKPISESIHQCPKCFNEVSVEANVDKNLNNKIKDDYEKLIKELSKKFDYKKALKSVVLLKAENSTGTGFIISNEGLVLTNSHVVNGETYCHGVIGSSPKVVELEVISDWGSHNIDLCLLKITEGNRFENLELESDETPEIGDIVYTIGNPKGLGLSLTKGTISRISKNGDIQLDLTVNPGNSGGPLLNEKGKVIGVISYLLDSVNGLGFAINNEVINKFLIESDVAEEIEEVEEVEEVEEETVEEETVEEVEEETVEEETEEEETEEETEEEETEEETEEKKEDDL